LFLGGCYTTQQSIGTTPYRAAYSSCSAASDPNVIGCLKNHPNFSQYTQAEKEMVLYGAVIVEKMIRGEMTGAEGELAMAQYAGRAHAASAAAERAAAAETTRALSAVGQSLTAIGDAERTRVNTLNAANPPMRMPVQTRCWRNGVYVNCTSY
jgi:hypothetical protein